jgi:EmrB/QacA subfamily drug resistance transporter
VSSPPSLLRSPGIADSEARLDPRLLRVALVVVLGSLMSIMDSTIVNVAINELSRQFNASLTRIQWVTTGYLLALAIVIPLTGWGAERFGDKRLYMASIVLFLGGSVLSGAAWSAQSLILFRVLQGLGGGMIIPAGMTILTRAAGPKRIGRVMGIVGVPMLLGPVLGPMLGGYFVDQVSWRWIFFINVPIGVLALLAAARNLDPVVPDPRRRLDWQGLLLLSPGLGVFVYGLAEIASGKDHGLTQAAVGVAVGLTLIISFIVRARRREDALIDVRLFARRTVGASAVTTFLFGLVFFGSALLMPLYLQIARGQSARQAGLLLALQGVGAMITMPIAGRLTDKTGPGAIVLTGLGLFALGTLGLSRITGATPLWWIGLALFLNGLGAGATMMPAMSAALRTLRHDEVARTTSGLNALLRVGGSIGTAIFAVALTYLRSVVGIGAAFGNVFLWSLLFVMLALAAALFLPRKGLGASADRFAGELYSEPGAK